jgi:hypothetical protein
LCRTLFLGCLDRDVQLVAGATEPTAEGEEADHQDSNDQRATMK